MYPVMVDFKGRLCTVIGGGRAALKKARNLKSDGAVIRVISPSVCAQLEEIADKVIYKPYSPEYIKGSFAVIAATDDENVNREILNGCRLDGVLCTSVQGGGDFQLCAAADCGGVTVAAYTGGEFPMLGSLIRDDMEKRYGGCGVLARLLGSYRREALKRGRRGLIKRFAKATELDITADELKRRLDAIEAEYENN